MYKNKKTLFMQDAPGTSSEVEKSHCKGFNWRRTIFKFAFKSLEVLLMILEIIKCFCEIFRS